MKKQKLFTTFLGTAVLITAVSLTGCQSKDQPAETAKTESPQGTSAEDKVHGGTVSSTLKQPVESEDTEHTQQSVTSKIDVTTIPASVDWETQEFADTYLSYQIPASWEQSAEYSAVEDLFTFFWPSESSGESLSNVNVQIASLGEDDLEMDYGAADVQADFHEFLVTEAQLPAEAADGEFRVYQTQDNFVYSLSFTRQNAEAASARQTAYFPMGLGHFIVIWATDWNDGCTPTADETALHICATLKALN